jgi:PAS domain S-box-containing protein
MGHSPDMTIEDFKFALQSADMGTWDIDLSSDTVYCSPEMLSLWDVSQEEFAGDRNILQKKVHPDDVLPMKEAIDKAIQSETIYDLEYRILPSPGTVRWVRSRGRCAFSPNSKKPVRFSGVVFDVTAAKEKDEALSLALKDRERFLIAAGHELKSPLAGLQLQLQVLEGELLELQKLPEKVTGSISRQKELIWRLVRIIDNISEHSQQTEESYNLKLESVDLVTVVSDLVDRCLLLGKSHHGMEINFSTTVPALIGKWDRFRIEHVVLNIISNALRYGNKKPVSVSIDRREHNALITVKDQGQGLRQSELEKIFDRIGPSSQNGGMGLGLYICQKIIRSHGGTITVKSTPGSGSEFTVTLPCKE